MNNGFIYQLQKNNGVTDKKEMQIPKGVRDGLIIRRKSIYRWDKTHRKKKLVSDMTPREHRLEKKKWKKRQQEHRTKMKKMPQETPPSTPEGTPKAHLPQRTGQQQQNPLRRKRMNDELKRKLTILEEQLNEQKKKNQNVLETTAAIKAKVRRYTKIQNKTPFEELKHKM